MFTEKPIDIRYLSYNTIYKADGPNANKLLPLGSYACFGRVIDSRLGKAHYEIYLLRDIQNVIEHYNNNFCFFTLQEVKRHLRLARRLFKFVYSVEESNYQTIPAYKINIDIEGSDFQHKYLLTWIRYLYEFPYNLFTYDALWLKYNYIPRESITNLIVLCTDSYNNSLIDFRHIHAISIKKQGFLKEYTLRNIISSRNKGYYSINELYPNCDHYLKSISFTNRDLNAWFEQSEMRSRLETYIKNYKILKIK